MANELIPIRLSHLLGHSGVGAIVRGANGLVVVQDTRQWTDRQGISAGKLIPYVGARPCRTEYRRATARAACGERAGEWTGRWAPVYRRRDFHPGCAAHPAAPCIVGRGGKISPITHPIAIIKIANITRSWSR